MKNKYFNSSIYLQKIIRLKINIFIILSFSILNILITSQFKSTVFASECECAKNDEQRTSVYDEAGTLYDIYGKKVELSKIPVSAVSLVPAVTEMIEAVNPGYRLKGVTNYDSSLNVAGEAAIVGGFYSPDLDRIKLLEPGMIFASSLHSAIHEYFKNSNVHVIILDAHDENDIYRNIEIIGRIFHEEKNAERIIWRIKSKIDNISKKLTAIPGKKRVRVVRVMGFDGNNLLVPGDDSFQVRAVRLAGGVPAVTNRSGQVTGISMNEWKSFNPQVVYTCGDSKKIWTAICAAKGWDSVDAVKGKRHLSFPCDLTCRPSVNYGAFIEYLSACLYGEYFFSSPPLKKDGASKDKRISVDIPYVKDASIRHGTIDDFEHNTLVLELKNKMDVLSTLTGMEKADIVGNHYLSPPRWNDGHTVTLDGLKRKICNAANADFDSSSFLITGADMNNLAVVEKHFKDLRVYVLATAGVMSNAQRQSIDEGLYYPHGTINMIVLANAHLTQGAMARAIVAATEAKTAALQDMDVRSSYKAEMQATGTGTDNIIVISGEGAEFDSAGGHTKIGELTARAAYEAVVKAVDMQNNLRSARSVFERLEERKISLYDLAASVQNIPPGKIRELCICMERALTDREIAGFIETAFALSDSYSRNLVSDISLFYKWSLEIAQKMAGVKVDKLIMLNDKKYSGSPIGTALSAIVTGAVYKVNKDQGSQ